MEKLTPEEFKDVIRGLNEFENPPAVMIFGEPGIGKSFAVREIAAELGRKYMPLSLGRLEAYDIKGMPDLHGQFMEWKPPVIWKQVIEENGRALLHFDEFTLADEAVQGAVLDVVQMKSIDGLKLPDGTMIVISGNMGGDDGTFAKILTSALTGGRAAIFGMKRPGINDWIKYQRPAEIIENFLRNHPNQLYRGPNSAEPFSPWTCPRAWSLYDMVIKKLGLENLKSKPHLKKQAVMFAKSLLSEETVNQFIDFLENSSIDALKVTEGDKEMTVRFLQADNFRQASVIKEAAKLKFKTGVKKIEVFQRFTDFLTGNNLPQELLALFAEELVKHDPETLVKLKVAGMPMDRWADKLLMA
ncbi:MAG: hypothetical protein CVV21_05510 [Candidatus Goldiibacteriota bacterium HGW-Goldbacteria-1]|jgi:hypothetical protein|nr:MAG: hypothetical protein CVV21_05510 [Candidatus Goldiibacteriota bacterium HGW-Goldbacteria-1]